MVEFVDKNYEKVDGDLFELVYAAGIGWSKLFVQAQGVLREMEARKIIPHDLWLKSHKLCTIDELPKRYRKE